MKSDPRVPWLTLGLVLICLVSSFAVTFNPDLLEKFGFHVNRPSLLAAFTSLFVHANTLHLLGNMLALAAIGTWVEEAAGSIRFLVLYLAGGIAGVALHWMVMRNATASPVLVGASGSVACCVAFGSVRYMWSRVSFGPRIRLPVVGVAAVWVALQLFGAFVQIGQPTGGVSFWSHLGGIVAGLVFATLFGAAKDASLHRGRKNIEAMDERSAGAQISAARAHLRHHPDDIVAWRQVADAAQQLHLPDEEVESRLRLIELVEADEVYAEVLRLAELDGLGKVPSIRRCRMAEQYVESAEDAAVVLLQSVAAGPKTDPQRPEALYRLAELDEPRRAGYLAALRRDHPMEPATARAESKGLIP